MLLYPVYALIFAGAGLTTSEISSLFVIWSVVSFVCEIPSGAFADVWSRKRVYALGEFLTATGYAVWLLRPSYPGFALGFVLWGAGGALSSGTLESLVHDRSGDPESYTRTIGRGGTIAQLSMLAAALLATPALAAGGYRLVGAISIATVTLGGLLALRLPEEPRRGTSHTPDDRSTNRPGVAPGIAAPVVPAPDDRGYRAVLRAGLREATGNGRVLRLLLVAALVPGFGALDEYLPLLAADKGAGAHGVPPLFALTAAAMAGGSALAARLPRTSPRRLAGVLTLAAALLAMGATVPHPAGLLVVAVAFGALQFAVVHTGTRLQEAISGPARTTVLSVSGFGAEVFAVAIYALFAVPLPLSTLFVLAGVPLLAAALVTLRR
ncbi:MFS transporter [Actinoplanes rectilineatus]|uniref:MFS transporter n=1 Tax=Actinoplanes rectilineatus TaxID=113571 RepID=UPI0009F8CE63|nr:MFS transporter [Actinoplanes rectilineatus]